MRGTGPEDDEVAFGLHLLGAIGEAYGKVAAEEHDHSRAYLLLGDRPLPQSMMPKATSPAWLKFAMDYIDVKWTDFAPNHRKSTADGLVTITLAW